MIRTAERYTRWNGDSGTRYYKYIPSNGIIPKGVILFYHGMGERSTTDLSLVERHGLPAYIAVDGIRSGVEIPFIVLCPQEEPPAEWFSRASDFIKHAQSFGLPIHKCGLSLGSMVDAEIINKLGPDVFATIATCCGKINELTNTFTEFGKIPTIHYYDPADKVIQKGAGYASVKAMHTKLKAAGKDSTMIEYTMPIGQEHNVWTRAYKPTEPNNYFTWLNSKTNIVVPPAPIKDPITQIYILNNKLTFESQAGVTIQL